MVSVLIGQPVCEIDHLLAAMWSQYSVQPTHIHIPPRMARRMKRLLRRPMPLARTSKMRRLRKLKYRRPR